MGVLLITVEDFILRASTNLWNSEIYLQVDYINFVNLQCRLIYILGDNGS